MNKVSMCMDCNRRIKDGVRLGDPMDDATISRLRRFPGISDGLCHECRVDRQKELEQYRKEKQCSTKTAIQ